jgi:hypothetical protein
MKNLRSFEIIQDTFASQMDAHQETVACLGKTEAMDLKASPKEMQSKVKHWEVPKECAAVKPVGGLRKGHRGRNLAAEHRQKQKEQIWGSCGLQKKLTAPGMRTTHHAKVTRASGTRQE